MKPFSIFNAHPNIDMRKRKNQVLHEVQCEDDGKNADSPFQITKNLKIRDACNVVLLKIDEDKEAARRARPPKAKKEQRTPSDEYESRKKDAQDRIYWSVRGMNSKQRSPKRWGKV